MNPIKSIALVLCLGLTAVASHAESLNYSIDLVGDASTGWSAGLSNPGGTAVNHTVSGTFSDTFTFEGYSSASIIDVWLDTSVSNGNLASQQIVFTSATLNGVALIIDPPSGSGNTIFRSAELFQQPTDGPLTLIVNGFAGMLDSSGAQISASYSGGLNVTPVPEPAPAALFMAGLGIVAWVARRRA